MLVGLGVLCFISLWFKSQRTFYGVYSLFLLSAFYLGAIQAVGLFAICITGILFYLYEKREKYSLTILFLLLTVGLLLGFHVVPGFNNLNYASAIELSSRSAEFDIWFNYDKLSFGLLGAAILLHSELFKNLNEVREAFKKMFIYIVLAVVGIYAIAVGINYSAFDFTANAIFLPWALKNLVFTVLAEEVFFRGIIQRELSKRFLFKGLYSHVPVFVGALLFGLAHFSGGIEYIFLSFLAGLLYGYSYKVTGKIEMAILSHFLLNVCHFIFFAYPYSV